MFEGLLERPLFEKGEELRLFTFGHFQLSSIQQGIQALHATSELHMQYQPTDGMTDLYKKQMEMLHTWALDWKTVVCKNGGASEDLSEIIGILESFPYPWSLFEESEEAMEGLTTAAAVVLPARIFDTGVKLRKSRNVTTHLMDHNGWAVVWFTDKQTGEGMGEYLEIEMRLIDMLINTHLAR